MLLQARHRDTRMSDKRSTKKTTTSFTGSRATDTTTSLDRSHFLDLSRTNRQPRDYTLGGHRISVSNLLSHADWSLTGHMARTGERPIDLRPKYPVLCCSPSNFPSSHSVCRSGCWLVSSSRFSSPSKISLRVFPPRYPPKIWLNENAHAPRQIARCA